MRHNVAYCHDRNFILGHRLVKELEELAQRDLVHAVDEAHLTDKKIQDAAARRNYTCTSHVPVHCRVNLSTSHSLALLLDDLLANSHG